MQKFSISKHPIDGNIIREVEFSGLTIDNDLEYGFQVKLRLKVHHYIMVENVKTIHPLQEFKYVVLTANNSTMVDGNGMPVEEGGLMGEFDFFMMLIDNEVVIADLIAAKIQWADSYGRFDI